MSRSPPRATGGFTLVEAIISVTLGTALVLLVWSVFLAQNELYNDIERRGDVHDEARSVVDLVAGDVRPATGGSFLVAERRQLVLREPLSMGVVCDVRGSRVSTYLPRGSAGLDTAHVTGYGIRASDGTWRYYDGTWSRIYDGSGQGVANDCEAIGFDTDGIPVDHFVRLQGPGSRPSPRPREGGALMLHRDLELRFATSELDTAHIALYRGTYGDTLVEFASSLGPDAGFEYRLRGESTFSAPVTGSDLARINAVRITAHAVAGDQGGGRGRFDFRLARDVPIRNEN